MIQAHGGLILSAGAEGRLVLFPLAHVHISVCSGMTTPYHPWQGKVGTYQCEESALNKERDNFKVENKINELRWIIFEILEI